MYGTGILVFSEHIWDITVYLRVLVDLMYKSNSILS